jgi:tetratricopeptide (TPR) repeat protein
MKSLAVLLLLSILLCFPSKAIPAENLQAVQDKLNRWETEEAWTDIQGLLAKDPHNGRLLELASQIAFFRGQYAQAQKLIQDAIAAGEEDEESRRSFALFVEASLGVMKSFVRYESPHFRISLDPKQDGILVDYLIATLEKTYAEMARQFAFHPQEKIRVEVFPDAQSFYYASSLSAQDIEGKGAVGLTNFNKLMILSPRALVYGYRWLDSISHEYIHYLIVKQTANQAPIWFHEGMAKYEETAWRKGSSYLSPLFETLLARALADGKLIGFDQMEPSLIHLETAEEVQLGYAQAASAIEFLLQRGGQQKLEEIIQGMAHSTAKGAGEAIRNVFGWTMEEFEKNWKTFLAGKGLREQPGVDVRRLKIKEGREDENRLDMAEIKSLVARNRAHLGDRLKERGRAEAAIREYRRALSEDRYSVPILNRLSAALIFLERDGEAIEFLNRARELDPDHPTIYTQLGQIYFKKGAFPQARDAFQDAIQINPFDPRVHQGLAAAYEALGDLAGAGKEREIAQRLHP